MKTKNKDKYTCMLSILVCMLLQLSAIRNTFPQCTTYGTGQKFSDTADSYGAGEPYFGSGWFWEPDLNNNETDSEFWVWIAEKVFTDPHESFFVIKLARYIDYAEGCSSSFCVKGGTCNDAIVQVWRSSLEGGPPECEVYGTAYCTVNGYAILDTVGTINDGDASNKVEFDITHRNDPNNYSNWQKLERVSIIYGMDCLDPEIWDNTFQSISSSVNALERADTDAVEYTCWDQVSGVTNPEVRMDSSLVLKVINKGYDLTLASVITRVCAEVHTDTCLDDCVECDHQ